MTNFRTVAATIAVVVCVSGLVFCQRIPIPVVNRDGRSSSTPLARAGLVVLGTIRDKCAVEQRSIDGKSWQPPRIRRQFGVQLEAVVKVNERLELQPDLADRRFNLLMNDTDDLDLGFGKMYILFIDFAPKIPSLPWLSKFEPPPYTLALRDAGFEDDGSRVHVLRQGGELAAYDGKPTGEVLSAIANSK
jgi:hypothetical protein